MNDPAAKALLSPGDYPREPVVMDGLSVAFLKSAGFLPLSLRRNHRA